MLMNKNLFDKKVIKRSDRVSKRILLSLLCLIAIFSMAGCGDKKVEKENTISYDEVEKQYENYIKNKKYTEFSNKWDVFQKEPCYYAIFDIDKNGVPEMIIANDTLNFPNSLVYTYDVDNNKVTLLKEVNETYGVLRYSESERSLVYNDFKSTSQYASLTYLRLNNNKLEEKSLIKDENTYYIVENKQKKQISEKEYNDFLENVDDIDYLKISELQEDNIENTDKTESIEINGYTLNYGAYKSSIEDAVFTLKEDGIFTFTGLYYFDINTKTTITGTYEVTTQPVEDGVTGESFSKNVIIFTYGDKTVWFIISGDNLFKSQEDTMIYQGS